MIIYRENLYKFTKGRKKRMEKKEVKVVKLPEGKCCTLYCGDCSYFNAAKTSFGKCWCGYYKSYSRNASNIACSNFRR